MCEDNSESGIYGVLYLDPRGPYEVSSCRHTGVSTAEPPPPPPSEGPIVEPPSPLEVLTTDEVGDEQPYQIATSEVFFGKEPVDAYCIHCGKVVKTVTELVPGDMEHVPVFRHCSIGFYCGCCQLPYVLVERKEVHHTCPYCQGALGRYKRC
nr:hypothetical transcript [Hymenolepis microstoma]